MATYHSDLVELSVQINLLFCGRKSESGTTGRAVRRPWGVAVYSRAGRLPVVPFHLESSAEFELFTDWVSGSERSRALRASKSISIEPRDVVSCKIL